MPAQPESAYVRLGLDGMSAGLLRDLRNCRHSVSDFKPSRRMNARASEKERNLRCRLDTLSVPSQSPHPAQPDSAYVPGGHAGM
jgi:hypothetical protein